MRSRSGERPRERPGGAGGVHPCRQPGDPAAQTDQGDRAQDRDRADEDHRQAVGHGGVGQQSQSREQGADADEDVHHHPQPGADSDPLRADVPPGEQRHLSRAHQAAAGRDTRRDQHETDDVAGQGIGQQRDAVRGQRPLLQPIGTPAVAQPTTGVRRHHADPSSGGETDPDDGRRQPDSAGEIQGADGEEHATRQRHRGHRAGQRALERIAEEFRHPTVVAPGPPPTPEM